MNINFFLAVRLFKLERKVDLMTTAVENLTAAEAELEVVVAAIVVDNTDLHAQILGMADGTNNVAVQAIADKVAAQTAALQGLLAPVVTPPVNPTPFTPAAA